MPMQLTPTDFGFAVCALHVGHTYAVGMQKLDRAPREYIAGIAERIFEFGFKTSTLKYQNGDVHSFEFSVIEKRHKPLVAESKVDATSSRIMLQPEDQGGS